MSLSKIVQESVSKYNEQYVLFKFAGQVLDEPQILPSVKPKEVENFLISSQILLLEEVIKYAYSQMQDERPVDCIDGETPVETYGYEETHNQALKIVITYLTEQIEKIKKQ